MDGMSKWEHGSQSPVTTHTHTPNKQCTVVYAAQTSEFFRWSLALLCVCTSPPTQVIVNFTVKKSDSGNTRKAGIMIKTYFFVKNMLEHEIQSIDPLAQKKVIFSLP